MIKWAKKFNVNKVLPLDHNRENRETFYRETFRACSNLNSFGKLRSSVTRTLRVGSNKVGPPLIGEV